MSKRVGLIVVAAGQSSRMGGVDKVWALLNGEPLFMSALARLEPMAAATTLVVRADDVDRAERQVGARFGNLRIVAGGDDRRASVAAGLLSMDGVEVVAVHDAARPLVPPELLEQAVTILDDVDVAVPALPINDTVKEIDDRQCVLRTIDRSHLVTVQTPQVFTLQALRDAHEAGAEAAGITDDAMLLEALGRRVRIFPGSVFNLKVTTPNDLALVRLIAESGRP